MSEEVNKIMRIAAKSDVEDQGLSILQSRAERRA